MDVNKIKRVPKEKKIMISIRISGKLSRWLRDKNYSPTSIFFEACKDIGYKEE